MQVERHTLDRNGGFPNSRMPVLVYRGVAGARDAAACERLFAGNGWLGAWQDGIFSFHHFHSTAHEVLGIVAGSVAVILGGPGGSRFEVSRGDVLVLPAGTGHFNDGATADLLVIGAYPDGMEWDLRRGDPDDLDDALANIRAVPLPAADPVEGEDGPLVEAWGA